MKTRLFRQPSSGASAGLPCPRGRSSPPILAAAISALLAARQPILAATYTWDTNTGTAGAQDGAGTWSTTGSNWWTGSADVVWPNTYTAVAVFGGISGTAGTVTIGSTIWSSVTCGGITFNATASGSYTLAGGDIYLGSTSGTITANANATISSELDVGDFIKAGAGTLTLTGNSSIINSVTVDSGRLLITGPIFDSLGYVGASVGSSGTVTVAGGSWTHAAGYTFGGGLINCSYVGISGTGTVNLNGGSISGSNCNFGYYAGSMATANVTSGTWSTTNSNFIGIYGTAVLNVSGGTMTDAFGCLGYYGGSYGTATVSSGAWNNSTLLTVGSSGTGALTISGGAVSSSAGNLAANAGSIGTVLLTGGTWNNAGTAWVGYSGTATLTITGSSIVVVNSGTGTLNLAQNAGSAGTLNLGSGDTAGLLNAASVNGGAGSATVNFNHSNSLLFTPSLTGTLTVNKLGTGAVILTASNTYSGSTVIACGTLQVGNGGSTGDLSVASNPISGSTGAVLAFNRSNNIVVPNSIVGGLSIVQLGSGTATLTGSNSFTGGIAANNGVIALGNSWALGTIGPIVFGGGTLQYSSSNLVDYSGRFLNSSAAIAIDTNGQNAAFASSISASNTGGLTKIGAGTLTLSASNAFTGTVGINSGILNLGDSNAIPSTISFAGGSLQYTGRNQVDYSGKIVNSTGAISVDTNGQDVTFASGIASSNTGGMIKSGAGTLRLGGSNSCSGPVVVTGGTLTVFNANGCQNGTVTLAGGGVIFGSSSSGSAYTFGGLSAPSSGGTYDILLRDTGGFPVALTVGGNNADTAYCGILRGPGSLIKSGAGTLTLSGSNAYSGPTVLFGGAVNLGAPENSGLSGPLGVSGSIILNGGFLQYSAVNQYDYSGQFSATANQCYNVDTNGQNVTWAAALASFGGSLFKSGSGTLTITGSNTFTGPTTLNGGVLGLGVAEQPGTSGPLGLSGTIVLNGGTIQPSSVNQYDYSARFSTAPNQHYNIDTNGQDVTWTAPLGSLGGSLSKTGTGTLTLAGSNSYSGPALISGGTLRIANQFAAQNSTVTIANSTLTFDDSSAGNAFTIGGIAGPSGVVLVQGSQALPIALTVGGNNANTSFSGTLTGAGSLTKVGNGKLTFYGSNTYAGSTTVAAGVLQLGAAEDPGASGPLGASGPIFLTGGCLQYSASNQFDYSERFSAANNQQYSVDTNGQNVTWAAALKSAGAPLAKSGLGTLTLTGSNTLNGGVTLSGGAVNLGAPECPGVSGPLGLAGTILFNGGWLQYSAVNQFDYSARFSTASNQQYAVDTNGQNVVWATPLTSTGGNLTKTGAGTLTLTGSNTFGGITTIAGGTLQLGYGSSVNGAVSGNIIDNAALVFANAIAQSYSGVISGSGSLSKTGTGTLTLSASNSFTGATTVTSGTLCLITQYALAGSTLSSGGMGLVFDSSVTGRAFAFGGLSGTANLALVDNGFNAVALNVGENNGSTTYSQTS